MNQPPRICIVSAADDRYAPMLFELIDSLRAHPQGATVHIGVVSTGMSDAVKAQAEAKADSVVEGFWPDARCAKKARGRDWLLGRVVKLFLPESFPGHDIYIWIDADAWVCDWRAIDLLVEGARHGALAAVVEDRDPLKVEGRLKWLAGRWPLLFTWSFKHARRARLPRDVVRRLTLIRPFNGGVFALRADAPHWQSARDHMARLVRHARIFGSNQLALNLTHHLDGLPVQALPSTCNFIGRPKLCAERGVWVGPYVPHEPVGILHLADSDMRLDAGLEEDFQDTTGGTVRTTLRYRPERVVRR